MFVNNDGDPTRGTISFSKYPEHIILDNNSIIAVLPAADDGVSSNHHTVRELEVIPISEEGDPKSTSAGFVQVLIPSTGVSKVGLNTARGLQEVILPEIGTRLRYARVHFSDTPAELDEESDVKRNLEELEVALRLSKISGNTILYAGKMIWRLLPSPMVVRLDCRLPLPVTFTSNYTPSAREDGYKRRKAILSVLKEVKGLEPTTELMFHEISYIKQKCGILLLAEFLRLPRQEDKRQFPVELLATETALIEGSLDPRVVVSLFPGFEEELKEGGSGVWLYGGVKEVVDVLLHQRQNEKLKQKEGRTEEGEEGDYTEELGWNGRRDILLLLRRYLSAWRQKKGFGSVSQADETEVFWTIDAALLRCLLTLESTRSPSASQHMAGEVDVRSELYKMVDFPPSIECFDRCVYLLERFKRLYVLSILYQSKRMSREVLETWRRLFESGDEKIIAEFGEGEDRIAEYLLGKKDKELVGEYGIWLANRHPRLGVKVFADEKGRTRWEVGEVLELLREKAPGALRVFVEFLVVEKKVCIGSMG